MSKKTIRSDEVNVNISQYEKESGLHEASRTMALYTGIYSEDERKRMELEVGKRTVGTFDGSPDCAQVPKGPTAQIF